VNIFQNSVLSSQCTMS